MATIPNPVAHPLGAPVVNNADVTVDIYSDQPTRVTHLVQDLTLQKFLLDKFFTLAGSVSGGAVLYDQITENDLYAIRDVEQVEAGEEFPIITTARLAPRVAVPQKWGGKFFVTDEARQRNDVIAVNNQARKVANTIVRKTNQYAVAVVQAVATANSRTTTGHNWSTAVPNGNTPTAPNLTPYGDINAAQTAADIDEIGVQYDTLLLNPQQNLAFSNFGQFDTAKVNAALADIGVTSKFTSNRVPAGTAYLLQSGQLGEYRVEKPLSTESWREPKTQQTWWQTDVRPVAYVTNPFAVMALTGLNG